MVSHIDVAKAIISGADQPTLVTDTLQGLLNEIARLRAGFNTLCVELEIGNLPKLNDTDILWFSEIETLWDYCAAYCDRPLPGEPKT
jgi:hypothetical protein